MAGNIDISLTTSPVNVWVVCLIAVSLLLCLHLSVPSPQALLSECFTPKVCIDGKQSHPLVLNFILCLFHTYGYNIFTF